MASSSKGDADAVPWGQKMALDLNAIVDTLNGKRKELEEDRESFEIEKSSWREAEAKLTASQVGDAILLNVGGFPYLCSVQLLQKIPDTYFSGLASGRWDLKRQKDGSVFIDREGSVFPLIMTFLRHFGTNFDLRKWYQTISEREKMLLKEESEFYMLPDMANPPSQIGSILSSAEWKIASPSLKNRQLVFKTSKSQPIPFVVTNEMKQPNMMILAKLPDGSVFGGFTSVACQYIGNWQSDNSSYLICKLSPSATLSKYPVQQPSYASLQNTTTIRFGAGAALNIQFNAIGSTLTSSTTCTSYPNLPIAISPARETEIVEIWRFS